VGYVGLVGVRLGRVGLRPEREKERREWAEPRRGKRELSLSFSIFGFYFSFQIANSNYFEFCLNSNFSVIFLNTRGLIEKQQNHVA
jgi:hypothetical protein